MTSRGGSRQYSGFDHELWKSQVFTHVAQAITVCSKLQCTFLNSRGFLLDYDKFHILQEELSTASLKFSTIGIGWKDSYPEHIFRRTLFSFIGYHYRVYH